MANKDRIEKLVETLLEPILEKNGVTLVDVEYVRELGHFYLRVYIDKEGGVTIKDCEHVSRALELVLDEKDPIQDPYILEVSSPGLDRPLKKDKDFERSIGKDVEMKLYKALDGHKEFLGMLVSYNKTEVVIKIDGEEKVFNRSDIALLRLSVVF
ncbi:MAG: ribosome maturation factor RimP [Firmicutes bacterium HGW-Firmicutes-2]|nr:MAG: ribosome maturation factor RimP [Firmicutes bacterium HGW-Firmicutes-2]